MIKKQSAKFSESCRLMQDSSKAELFRFGAANDEFDGFARYSELKMAVGNLGGNAGKVLVPWGMESLFFYPVTCVRPNLGGNARREARPKGQLLYFYIQRRFYHDKSI